MQKARIRGALDPWIGIAAALLLGVWILTQSTQILVAAVVVALIAIAMYRYSIMGEDGGRGVMLAQRSRLYQAASFELVLEGTAD